MKISIILIILTIMCSMLLGCESKPVEIVKDDSYFSDFEVKNSEVFIYCVIAVENKSDHSEKIKLCANMEEDVDIGLLKEAKLYGINQEDDTQEFVIPRHTIALFNVTFIGDYAGIYQKTDRLLPDITIEYIE